MSNTQTLTDLSRSDKASAFGDLIQSPGADFVTHGSDRISRASLINWFKKNSDILPSSYCAELDLPAGSTYAQAARALEAQAVS